MFYGRCGEHSVWRLIMSQEIPVSAVHLKSTDSVDLVLASPDQCVISGVQRTANTTETAIA